MKKKLLLTAMCFLTANNYMAETKKDIRSVLHSPETLRSLVKRSEEINQFLATKKQVEEGKQRLEKVVKRPQLPAYSATTQVQEKFQEITAAGVTASNDPKKNLNLKSQ